MNPLSWLLPLEKDGTVVPLDQIKAKMAVGTFGDHDNRLYRKVIESFLQRCRESSHLYEEGALLEKAVEAERVSKK